MWLCRLRGWQVVVNSTLEIGLKAGMERVVYKLFRK